MTAMTDTAIDQSDLARLQQAVLVAVLSGRPVMPGGPSIQLPDIGFASHGGGVSLSRENLAAEVDVDSLPQHVRVIAPEGAASSGGHIAFAPAQVTPGNVALTLQVRSTPPGAGQKPLPIGSLLVRFRRDNGNWTLAEAPAQSAS